MLWTFDIPNYEFCLILSLSFLPSDSKDIRIKKIRVCGKKLVDQN